MKYNLAMRALRFLPLLLAAPLAAQYPLPVQDADWADSNANVFLPHEVGFIEVTMDEGDLDAFIADRQLNTYVPCTVRFFNSVIDETYLNVGIRPRGNTARDHKKFPWKLSFNTLVPGRKFHGIEKLNVNSVAVDPSISRDSLMFQIFREAGVPAPRTTHIWMKINDGSKVLATYDACEQVDEEFVQAWFGSKTGDLYKCRNLNSPADLKWRAPGDAATYASMTAYEEEITGDFQPLADFIDFVNNSDDLTFATEIGQHLNVDGFLRAMAADIVAGQWDGYWIGANNYYLYHDPATGRMEYIPWDLDHSFGMDYWLFPILGNLGTNFATRPFENWGRNGFGGGLGTVGPPLMARILNVPPLVEQLKRYARDFSARIVTPKKMFPRVDELASMLAPYAFQGTYSGPTMENGFDAQNFAESWTIPASYKTLHNPDTWGIKPFISKRHAYIAENYPVPVPLPPVSLNEVMSDNQNTLADEAGEYDDWVEIHNASGQPFDLGGMWMSDHAGTPRGWQIPMGASVPAGGYLVVWCDNQINQGPLHANFKLSKNGEGVYLFGRDAELNPLVSSLLIPALAADQSWGRLPDGGHTYDVFPAPTALSSNHRGVFEMLVEGSCPGTVRVAAIQATPGGNLALLYSPNPGSWSISAGNPCAGTQLGLAAPVALATLLPVDGNGVARLELNLPAAACGVYVQMIDPTLCATTNVAEL
jgi:CotH protein/lamin tail-like protein